MFITKTANIPMQWESFTLPIVVGTPISKDGALANDETAVGIIIRQVNVVPPVPTYAVMTGGNIDLEEMDYSISEEAMGAISGVDFYGADLRPFGYQQAETEEF